MAETKRKMEEYNDQLLARLTEAEQKSAQGGCKCEIQ